MLSYNFVKYYRIYIVYNQGVYNLPDMLKNGKKVLSITLNSRYRSNVSDISIFYIYMRLDTIPILRC